MNTPGADLQGERPGGAEVKERGHGELQEQQAPVRIPAGTF